MRLAEGQRESYLRQNQTGHHCRHAPPLTTFIFTAIRTRALASARACADATRPSYHEEEGLAGGECVFCSIRHAFQAPLPTAPYPGPICQPSQRPIRHAESHTRFPCTASMFPISVRCTLGRQTHTTSGSHNSAKMRPDTLLACLPLSPRFPAVLPNACHIHHTCDVFFCLICFLFLCFLVVSGCYGRARASDGTKLVHALLPCICAYERASLRLIYRRAYAEVISLHPRFG